MLENVVDFIVFEMVSGLVDLDLVQSIGISFFSGIGNVLNVVFSKVGFEMEEKMNDENEVGKGDEDKGKEKVSMELCVKVNELKEIVLFLDVDGDNLLGW